ncbi:hypothetical protein PCASD_19604 [Puccinia coronata f. sp. avenae]|uniref:Uncharacterized protein n=1 Tax=Puccinia coronata f. sp. avenae TaxID=200324 RepID=A0A2N5SJB8_9BASI|nr:hypothetical protein PCASD_19604 [Puccinia coronata f. sp. avenae]
MYNFRLLLISRKDAVGGRKAQDFRQVETKPPNPSSPALLRLKSTCSPTRVTYISACIVTLIPPNLILSSARFCEFEYKQRCVLGFGCSGAGCCRITSADHGGSQKDRVRNDRVTQRCDENEENDSRRMMTGRSHGAKRSHEENPTPLANRITSRTPIFNSSLATRIEQGSNE